MKSAAYAIVILLLLLVTAMRAADGKAKKRLPVPDATAREQALATVRDLFKTDIDKAKTVEDQAALVEKLMKTAAETKDDPVSQFVLWQLAVETASKAGDVNAAFAAIDDMAQGFAIDELNVKSKTLVALAPKIPAKNIRDALPQVSELMDRAVADERFEIAKTVGEPLTRLAARLGDATTIKDVALQHADAERLEKAYADVPAALKTLTTSATDPAANLTVGKYQLEKGDWNAALSYLALSDDPQFNGLAAKELARPKDINERIAIADEWWKLGDADKTPLKLRLQAHAADLYTAALPDATGLTKKKLESRLEDYAKLPKGPGGKSSGRDARSMTNSIGLKLNLIPAGEFVMGAPETEFGRLSRELQHRVKITKPFYMGVFDVTRGQFAKFVAAEKYQTEPERDGNGAFGFGAHLGQAQSPEFTWRTPGLHGNQQTDDHPVVCVTWNDAVAFCDWLSTKENKKYRLPTEAEWEYACRAGTATAYYTGDAVNPKFANLRNDTTQAGLNCTTPVGSYRPNAAGLFDMHGNVWQWCQDWSSDSYYANSPPSDPTGPTSGTTRTARGGSWNDLGYVARSASRTGFAPAHAFSVLGFRVVCESAGAASTTAPKSSDTKPAPAPKVGEDTQVHLIAVFGGKYNKTTKAMDKISVKVSPDKKPIILVLNAYDACVWEVTAPPGSLVEVLAIGHSAQTVEGLEKGVRIRMLSELAGDKSAFVDYISDENPSKLSEGNRAAIKKADEKAATIIKALTGRDITSIQHKNSGVSFTVP